MMDKNKENMLHFKRSWVDTPTLTTRTQPRKSTVDFIKKNKTINVKDPKKNKLQTNKSISDRLKIDLSAKKQTTQDKKLIKEDELSHGKID